MPRSGFFLGDGPKPDNSDAVPSRRSRIRRVVSDGLQLVDVGVAKERPKQWEQAELGRMGKRGGRLWWCGEGFSQPTRAISMAFQQRHAPLLPYPVCQSLGEGRACLLCLVHDRGDMNLPDARRVSLLVC